MYLRHTLITTLLMGEQFIVAFWLCSSSSGDYFEKCHTPYGLVVYYLRLGLIIL